MPELPEVEMARRYLDATALHQPIHQVTVKHQRILGNVSAARLRERLVGKEFSESTRHGKYLFARTGEGWLVFHFGMTGRLTYFKSLDQEPEHDRLLFSFANGYHLSYDCQRLLGRISWAESVESFIAQRQLGPDALRVSQEDFVGRLGGKRGMVKSALMDQHAIAGIGNIYSDEILFQMDIHPQTGAHRLDRSVWQEMHGVAQDILREAIRRRAEPDDFPDSFLIPRREEGERCPRDGASLQRVRVSGRSAYFCPRHQKKM
ncbi:MAG: Fpg/Nei family DNA glycosylase [Thermoplasmatota archaeon]